MGEWPGGSFVSVRCYYPMGVRTTKSLGHHERSYEVWKRIVCVYEENIGFSYWWSKVHA